MSLFRRNTSHPGGVTEGKGQRWKHMHPEGLGTEQTPSPQFPHCSCFYASLLPGPSFLARDVAKIPFQTAAQDGRGTRKTPVEADQWRIARALWNSWVGVGVGGVVGEQPQWIWFSARTHRPGPVLSPERYTPASSPKRKALSLQLPPCQSTK